MERAFQSRPAPDQGRLPVGGTGGSGAVRQCQGRAPVGDRLKPRALLTPARTPGRVWRACRFTSRSLARPASCGCGRACRRASALEPQLVVGTASATPAQNGYAVSSTNPLVNMGLPGRVTAMPGNPATSPLPPGASHSATACASGPWPRPATRTGHRCCASRQLPAATPRTSSPRRVRWQTLRHNPSTRPDRLKARQPRSRRPSAAAQPILTRDSQATAGPRTTSAGTAEPLVMPQARRRTRLRARMGLWVVSPQGL